MRSYNVAVLGLVALSHALPTGSESAALEERQTFQIGDPSVVMTPGSEPVTPGTVWTLPPVEAPGFKIGRRGNYMWFPDAHHSDKDNIVEAQGRLLELQQQLDECTDKKERKSIQAGIDSIYKYLKKVAGITNIEAPPGTTTTFTPGKRSDKLASLKESYVTFAAPYKSGAKPSFTTYMILLHFADILALKGAPVDTFSLGPASTTFGVSTKRQTFTIGDCGDSQVLGLRGLLTSLLLIYGSNPPIEIYNLEQVVIAALKSCKQDVVVGPLTPSTNVPGGPIVADPTVSGGGIYPGKTVPGGPIQTST